MPPKIESLVLDTHVWVWAMDDGKRLAPRVIKRIDAAGDASELFVSAITPWEVAMLANRGRLRLGTNVLKWLEDAVRRSRVALAPLDLAIAVDSNALPTWENSDPSDRLIVATARQLGATLVTADSAILDLASETKCVRVLEPR